MVSNGQVRQEDENGIAAADEAAFLGRKRQLEHIVEYEKTHAKCLQLLVSIGQTPAFVFHCCFAHGGQHCWARRHCLSGWYSGCVLFFSWLLWASRLGDLGYGGASFLGLLILNELWAGERLVIGPASTWTKHRHIAYL